MKKSLLSLSIISALTLSSTTHAQITWGESITAGTTTLKASHINEIRDAIADLRTDVDAGGAGVWVNGAGGDVYYNGGDVGIGTTAPETTLHVIKSGTAQPTAIFEQTDTSPNVALVDATNGMRLEYNSTDDALRIQSANTNGTYGGATTATFTRTGNVGIRTTNPQASLHVGDGSDVTLTSIDHAATFGNHTAANIAIDNNEIMARNNGVESALHLNNDGGDVTIHNAQAGGTQVMFKDDGDVGIGISSPSQKLDVAGYVKAAGIEYGGSGAYLGSNIYYDGGWRYRGSNSGTMIRHDTGGDIQFYTAPAGTAGAAASVTERMRVEQGGNVGIGTTSPAERLQVDGAVRLEGSRPILFMTDTDTGSDSYVTGNSTTGSIGIVADVNSEVPGSYISLNVDGSERMRVEGNGNVGIGVNPTAKLDVDGTIMGTYLGRKAPNTGHLVGSYNNVGTNATQSNPIYTMGSAYNPGTTVLNNMYGIGFTYGTAGYIQGNGSGWGMYVAADGDARTFLSAGNGNSYINGNGGNVGIGTVSPSQRLHVSGNSLVTGRTYIGATDTSFYRDIANRIATDDTFYVQSASPNTYLYSTNTYLGNTSGDSIHLRGNRLTWNTGTLNTSGNMGIGTTAPSAGLKLDVAGKVGATEYCDQNGANCFEPSSIGGPNLIVNDNSLLDSCQLCTRYADNNGRASASWNCQNFGTPSNIDFIGDVNGNDDLDLRVSCSDPVINNAYQLCRRYADVGGSSTVSWECVDFGQDLLTDFVGDVDGNDEFAFAIKAKSLNTHVITSCGMCNRYADWNGRNSAGWRCGQIGNAVQTNFVGDVDSNDDFDFKLACDIAIND